MERAPFSKFAAGARSALESPIPGAGEKQYTIAFSQQRKKKKAEEVNTGLVIELEFVAGCFFCFVFFVSLKITIRFCLSL